MSHLQIAFGTSAPRRLLLRDYDLIFSAFMKLWQLLLIVMVLSILGIRSGFSFVMEYRYRPRVNVLILNLFILHLNHILTLLKLIVGARSVNVPIVESCAMEGFQHLGFVMRFVQIYGSNVPCSDLSNSIFLLRINQLFVALC